MANAPFVDGSNVGTVSFEVSGVVTTTSMNKLQVIGGDILVEDCILETGTSIAAGTGTLFEVRKTDTTYGIALILSHAISALTANVTFDMTTATTKNRSICKPGTYIAIGTTGANSSAGTARITIKYRKLQENSKVQVV